MKDEPPVRRTYEESCELLQELGFVEKGAVPPIPDHQPQYDDEEPLGVNFFRTVVCESDLENLTLPRTYFAKSQVGPVSLKNTDLSESTLCWNDFNDVNFTDADLSRCDLRASHFKETAFVRAKLRDADLRRSSFDACDFTEANMLGTKLTYEQGEKIPLSAKHRQAIHWQDSSGEVEWARTMIWKGAHPIVSLVEKTDETGVRIAKAAFKAVESRLQRDENLPKYDVLIQPKPT